MGVQRVHGLWKVALVAALCQALGACGRTASDAPIDSGGASNDSGGASNSGGANDSEAEVVEAALARLVSGVCNTVECVSGSNFEVRRVEHAIRAGRMSLNPDVVDRCLGVSVSAFLFDSRIFVPSPECADLWIPLTPLGEACDTDFECIDGFCARTDYSRSRPHYIAGSCGVCAPRGGVDAPCSGHRWVGGDRECATGLGCRCPDGSSLCDDGVCLAAFVADKGQLCAPGIDCQDGLVCVYGDDGTARGNCQVLQRAGSDCTAAEQCPGQLCLDVDESGVGVCGPRQVGAACANHLECSTGSYCKKGVCAPSKRGTPCSFEEHGCPEGLICVRLAGTDSMCLSPAQDGERCVGPEQCLFDTRCIDDLCRRTLGPGAECDASISAIDRCAEGATCVGGACQALPTLGEPCTTACAEGICENAMCRSRKPGAACVEGAWNNDECGEGLECGEQNTCDPRAVIGQACTKLQRDDGSDGGGVCDSGAYCDGDDACAAICVLD